MGVPFIRNTWFFWKKCVCIAFGLCSKISAYFFIPSYERQQNKANEYCKLVQRMDFVLRSWLPRPRKHEQVVPVLLPTEGATVPVVVHPIMGSQVYIVAWKKDLGPVQYCNTQTSPTVIGSAGLHAGLTYRHTTEVVNWVGHLLCWKKNRSYEQN